MARALIASCGTVAVGVVALGFGVLPAFGRGVAASHRADNQRLVESADCRHPLWRAHDPAVVAQPAAPPSDASVQSVAVRIPAVALLRVDGIGHITEAATNTGCAPQTGDAVYLVQPDGTAVQTAAVDIAQITWRGDFRAPGVYQPLH